MDARRHRLIQRRGWDRASAHYDRFWSEQLSPVQELLLDASGIDAGERVVEVACGTGVVTAELARRVGPTGRVLATDLSPAMVADTKRRMNDAGDGQVDTHQADAEDLGPIGPFDVALCSLGLMYAPDPAAAVGEMCRVVRPGGRVVASVWGERRHCGWADIFGIVDARVSSDVCPRFFALGAPGALAHIFRAQELTEVDEHRIDVQLRWADVDAALGAAFLGGPVALAYARFDESTRRVAHAEYLDSIAAYRCRDGSYEVPGEFVVVAARAGRSEPSAPSDRTPPKQPPARSNIMTITDTPIDNGVDTGALLAAREALTAAPEAAEFTWQATCAWVHGTHSNATVERFSGLGAEHTHRQTFRFDADHPECFASQDLGATPAEYVLVALASCLTAGVAAVAQHREIQLRSVTATLEGDMNVLGILGADPDVRNGFDNIRVRFEVDADASPADIEALVAQSQKRSAVFDVITNPTAITVEVA